MELTEALVTEDITPFERERLAPSLVDAVMTPDFLTWNRISWPMNPPAQESLAQESSVADAGAR